MFFWVFKLCTNSIYFLIDQSGQFLIFEIDNVIKSDLAQLIVIACLKFCVIMLL